MKRFIVLAVFLSLFISVNAQDLVVTFTGDSLNCKIDSATTEYLYFNSPNKDGAVPFTQLPLDLVKFYTWEYYDNEMASTGIPSWTEDQKSFWLSINIGRSYRFGEIDPSLSYPMQSYLRGLKGGTVLGVNAVYFIGYSSGIGLNYSRFTASNSKENIELYNIAGKEVTGDMADNIAISYFGPSYASRLISSDLKHALTACCGIGYMKYHDEGKYVSDVIITGSSLGMLLDVGYNYHITANLAIGIQTSFIGGVLTKYEMEYGGRTRSISLDEDEYESLSRADLSIRLTVRW